MNSQNGWPVVGKSSCDQGPFGGVTFPNGILKGDVAVIARWQLARYEDTVEPLIQGECWGWFVKPIEGSNVISNHSSATAWDINATQNPMGVPAARSLSTGQIAACHAIEAASHGTLRWGGDFTRPDPMHWEIVGSRAQVGAFAAVIRNQQEEDDMIVTLDDASISKLSKGIVDAWVAKDLGAAGGGDTLGVVMQTGVLGNSNRALKLLEQIAVSVAPVPPPVPEVRPHSAAAPPSE